MRATTIVAALAAVALCAASVMAAEPEFDATIESRKEAAANTAEAVDPIAVPTPVYEAPRALVQYATLYAFPPDMCQLREHSAVYDFIDNEAVFYEGLDVVFVSMDGDPPVLRFFTDPSKQQSATIDAGQLSTEQLLKLIEQHTAREKSGGKLADEEKGYEVNIKALSVSEIKALLAQQNVRRLAEPRPNWKPPVHEETTAPGFKVPDHITESGEPEVDIMEIDDTILPGATARKAAILKEREEAAAKAAAAAAATAAAASK